MSNKNLAPDNINNIDDLFEYLYGVRPRKKGVSAELFYYVIKKILNVSQDVKYYWDEKISLYNNNNIQMDVVAKINDRYKEISDIKDWNKNINRPEIQKIESTAIHLEDVFNLDNLEVNLISTKGFSLGAKEWADKSKTKSKIKLSIMRLTEDIDIKDKIVAFNFSLFVGDRINDIKFIFSYDDYEYNNIYLKDNNLNLPDFDLTKVKLLTSNDTLFNLINNKYDIFLPKQDWIEIEKSENEIIYSITKEEPIIIEYDNFKFHASGIKFKRKDRLVHNEIISKGKCFISLCDENNKLIELFFEEDLIKYKSEVLSKLNINN
ncbi:hypothetical protein [Brachyspira hampsonii]|uniref:hypothetical protein n=1 Tax=Brachyspira hampsonii TaxID=1287055 RepID=UPI001CA5A442|nr:hypothetical protein [Brachyspira hampsonii]MBW5390384.1 hypothetical protein [Brachyspira hampsonii]